MRGRSATNSDTRFPVTAHGWMYIKKNVKHVDTTSCNNKQMLPNAHTQHIAV